MSSKILSDSESHMDQSLSSPGNTPSSSTDRKVSEDFTGRYPYEPLQSKEHIRLLCLEPPVASSTQNIPVISATLHEVNLFAVGEDSCPSYKALSYEWGSPPSNPSDTPTMLLDNHLIRIRQNLSDALQSILHNHEELYGKSPLYLWVDALCINQLDDREKGHQVQLMKNIYKGAELVIVWLGMGTACTDEAMELLKMERGYLDKYVQEGNLSWKERQGLMHLYCDATYWRRVWIVQEFVLARDYVVLCNRAFVTKQKFERGLEISKWFWKMDKWWPTDRPATWDGVLYTAPVERLIKLRPLYKWERSYWLSLIAWLDTVCSYKFEATDPRDYVFALLGISHEGDKIEPDYELSTWEVYCIAIRIRAASPCTHSSDSIFHLELADIMGIPRDRALELQQILGAEEEDMSNLGDQDMWDSDLESIQYIGILGC